MAQDFERATGNDVSIGTSAVAVHTSNSDDAIIGIRLGNLLTSTINVSVFITSSASGGSADSYLVKNAPIAAGGSLELIDGGAKVVVQNGDVLKVQSDTANSVSAWVSIVDSIST